MKTADQIDLGLVSIWRPNPKPCRSLLVPRGALGQPVILDGYQALTMRESITVAREQPFSFSAKHISSSIYEAINIALTCFTPVWSSILLMYMQPILLWYETGADQEPSRTIGINPEISIRRTKLISNHLVLLVVYI
jgi:hypothetical protein